MYACWYYYLLNNKTLAQNLEEKGGVSTKGWKLELFFESFPEWSFPWTEMLLSPFSSVSYGQKWADPPTALGFPLHLFSDSSIALEGTSTAQGMFAS